MYWWERYCRELLELNPSGSLAARVEWKVKELAYWPTDSCQSFVEGCSQCGDLISKYFWLPLWRQTDSVCKRKLLIKEIPVLVAGNGVSVHQSVEGEGKSSSFRGWEETKPVITRVSRKRGNPQASRGWESSHISNTKLLWPITWMMNRKPKWAQCITCCCC